MTKLINEMLDQGLVWSDGSGRYSLRGLDDATLAPLVGLEIKSVDNKDTDGLFIGFVDGTYLLFLHRQDCCESVYLEESSGLDTLVGQHFAGLSETSSEWDNDYGTEGWTFYNISTREGHATLRFCGSSNGYYSIGVDVYLTDEVTY